MIRSHKVSFIFLISFLNFHVSAQECDLRCQMESMLGSKPENKSSTPSRASERSYSSSKPLIHDVKEVQDFLDQITLYFVGEEFIKVGSVRGDLDSFNIRNIDLERGKGLVKVKHDVNDSERDQIFVKVNGKPIGTLDNFNNDILVLDAGRNDIELTKGDITRKESFKVGIDDLLNWEVAFIESVEINISF